MTNNSIIEEAKIDFLHVYTLPDNIDFENNTPKLNRIKIKKKCEKEFIKEKCDIINKEDCDYFCKHLEVDKCNVSNLHMFSITDEFYYRKRGNTIKRFELDTLELCIRELGEQKRISCSVILSYFPEVPTCSVMIYFKLQKFTIEKLIYLRQCFYKDTKFELLGSNILDKCKISFKELFEKYSNFIGIYSNTYETLDIPYTILELNDFDGLNVDFNDVKVLKPIYGLLTSDEGWDFVPADKVKSKINISWSTREFIRVFSHLDSCVVFNFVKSPSAKTYREYQKKFRQNYFDYIEQYYMYNPNIAGLNHGILYTAEMALVLKSNLQKVIKDNNKEQKKDHHKRRLKTEILRLKKNREEIIEVLKKLEFKFLFKVEGLGELLLENMKYYVDKDKLINILQLTENDILFKYQEKINKIIILFTVISTVFAIISTIFTFIFR
ncbi:hypothetical protein [Acetivibrio cellulolyticus]|uniref:hypothetical protein n=1 Tax=Acetivibrio cellulolyticus TaxID=35830 RepID=UPI0001E2C279|nr:hypothetical protein [Acetivibrio cellulolyticus]